MRDGCEVRLVLWVSGSCECRLLRVSDVLVDVDVIVDYDVGVGLLLGGGMADCLLVFALMAIILVWGHNYIIRRLVVGVLLF